VRALERDVWRGAIDREEAGVDGVVACAQLAAHAPTPIEQQHDLHARSSIAM
jgi:hypothetical protein